MTPISNSKPMNIRMPIDIVKKLDAMRDETGLKYTDIVIASLRKTFGLPSRDEKLANALKGNDDAGIF